MTILIPGVNANDPPVAEDDSKTTSLNEPMSDNVIEPNGSDPDGDDLMVEVTVNVALKRV